MQPSALIGLVVFAAAAALPAHAETLRCGNSLIAEGVMMAEVMQKCGEPDSRTQVSEPIRARYPNGNSYVVGTTTQELWHYQRRNGQFPADLTFEGGVLKRIDFQK
jgi:hypothetical protein